MINDSYGTAAFPRQMPPPPIPVHRAEPHSMMHYHNHMGPPPPTGSHLPRDHHAPGVSPIAHAIANQILNSHLHNAQVQHFAQMGLNDGIQSMIANRLQGVGAPGYQSPFGPPPGGMLPQLSGDYQPANPFSRF